MQATSTNVGTKEAETDALTLSTTRPAQKMAIVGVPSSAGTHFAGAEMGPDALRAAGIATALAQPSLTILDQGNLSGPKDYTKAETGNAKNLDTVLQWNQLVFNALSHELAQGHLPLLLGGDHSLAIGSINAAANHCRQTQKKLLVLWFDAHTDANTPEISPSGNIHGMPIACLLNHGPSSLTRLGLGVDSHVHSAIQNTELYLIGVRSIDEAEKEFVKTLGLRIFDMDFIHEFGILKAIQTALATVDNNTHIHLSFDLDCLDPKIAPGVSVPEANGVSYRDMQLCMEMICNTGRLGSVDLVELNPTRDINNKTADLAIDLLKNLFGKK